MKKRPRAWPRHTARPRPARWEISPNFSIRLPKAIRKCFCIQKAFSISQAIINTLVGATKALATLPPPGEIAAAGVVAAGMATVAKIVAEKPPAMATGGAMTIPGSGGIDSRMVSFMGSPGETVRVDQNKYGESGGARTITLAGVKPKDYYRGDVLRDFVDNLNAAIGDGLKISSWRDTMGIVITQNYVLLPSQIDFGLTADHPVIGWQTVVTPGSVSASSQNPNYPASNLANPATHLGWKAAAAPGAGYVYITITNAGLLPIDYVAIARHNLGSKIYSDRHRLRRRHLRR